uniref:ShKT domain-containing protein n=1 Tax=Pinctada fucata TaxID=50426 RepID=A0A194AK77_PINFU
MQTTLTIIVLAGIFFGVCLAGCQDNRNDCQKINCIPNGLEWSVKNCAKTCNYCNKTKCFFEEWSDLTSCSKTCGGGSKQQIRLPKSVVPAGTLLDHLKNVDDCWKDTQTEDCNVQPCPTNPPSHQVVYNPVITPEHVAVAAGTAAVATAAATIGATIGETLLGLLPALAFGKRSAIEERDVLDLFIRKIQEKRDAMK